MPTAQLHSYESIIKIAKELRKMSKPRVLQSFLGASNRRTAINLDNVTSIEESETKTTVWTTDGESCTINIPYDEVLKAWLGEA